VGRATTAIELARDVVRNDPLSAFASAQLRLALDAAGQRDEAEAEYQRSLDFHGAIGGIPDDALFRIWNDGDDALTAARFDQLLAAQTPPMPVLAEVREVFDDPEAARALLRAGFDDPANQDPTRQRILAIYAGHFGDPELAVAALRRSYIEMGGSIFLTLWNPDMAAARRTPDFKDLVRDLGLVEFWRESGDWGDFCRPVGEDDFECI
jgi:tetratricopeptide (TPR) repeat protein